MVVWPSWPQPWKRPGMVERHLKLVFSSIGSASMSARKPMRLPLVPLPLSTPTTPVPPRPRCTSMPHCVSLSATIPEVRTSSKPISGWACRSLRIAVSSSAKPSMRSMLGMFLSVGRRFRACGGCGREWRAVGLDPNTRTQPRPRQCRGVGGHRARCGAYQKPFGDRLEIGAKMHRALVDENRLLGRFDADIAIHRLIGELRLARTHDHADTADAQGCRRPHVHVAAAIIGTGRYELSVGQFFDDEGLLVRRIARDARLAAERERDGGDG